MKYLLDYLSSRKWLMLPPLAIAFFVAAALTAIHPYQNAQWAVPNTPMATPHQVGFFTPLTAPEGLNDAQQALGERLFHDPILSSSRQIACVHCHRLGQAGVDGASVSTGSQGRQGTTNAPTVFNSSRNFRQFWDGRAATLEEQINGPLSTPHEMDSDWPTVLGRLRQHPDYPGLFDEAFGDDHISADRVRQAIATFERSLITMDSPFDQFLRGQQQALSPEQRRGMTLFIEYGCVSCHQGQNIGGNMYARFGIFGDAANQLIEHPPTNLGRYRVTGKEQDRFVFKVPSLRNVARTAPYFHDGSVASLDEAVLIMGLNQLGIEIPKDDRRLIVAFLESLTGRYRGASL